MAERRPLVSLLLIIAVCLVAIVGAQALASASAPAQANLQLLADFILTFLRRI